MKTLFARIADLMTEAAMFEGGVRITPALAAACDPLDESLEENLVEVAFAEAADYDDIHAEILKEHLKKCAAA